MSKALPNQAELVDYNHAAAGQNTLRCRRRTFIKPCTPTEVEFYETSRALHPEFVDILPRFLGVLSLEQKPDTESIEEVGARLLTKAYAEQADNSDGAVGDSKKSATGKRIKTNQAVVLENASHGFRRPNILDVKLGVRLWADDAPEEKRNRFEKITAESTHKDLGFRIAGMRVWQGLNTAGEDIDPEGYRIYDKNYGRVFVNKENVHESFKKFIFNEGAGIDEDLGKLITKAFHAEVQRIQTLLENHENRMFSASLLFVFEGDGSALRTALKLQKSPSHNSKMRNKNEDDDGEETKTHSVKLIDFAHAKWTPGSGPDENTLLGVRSVGNILKNLV